MFAFNEVFLAGTLAKDPVTSFQDNGAQVTTTRLCIAETRDNQTFRLWVDIRGLGQNRRGVGRPAGRRCRGAQGAPQVEKLGERGEEAGHADRGGLVRAGAHPCPPAGALMPAHWHSRFAPQPLQTLCWLWSRDASRLVKKRWVKRETQVLIAKIGEVVWARQRGKRRG